MSFSDSSDSLKTDWVLLNLINRLMCENIDDCSAAEVDLLCVMKSDNDLKFDSFKSVCLTMSSFKTVKINILWSESASVCSVNFTSSLLMSVLSSNVCRSDSVRTVVMLIDFFTNINDWEHKKSFVNKLLMRLQIDRFCAVSSVSVDFWNMSIELRDFFSFWCSVNSSVLMSNDFEFSEFNIDCYSEIFLSLTSDVWDDKCEWLEDVESEHEITSDEFKIFFFQFDCLCFVSMFIESSVRVSFLSSSVSDF